MALGRLRSTVGCCMGLYWKGTKGIQVELVVMDHRRRWPQMFSDSDRSSANDASAWFFSVKSLVEM